MLFLHAGQGLWALGMVPQAQNGGCGKGPREMGVPEFLARGTQTFASRCLRTLEQATIRGDVRHPGEAVKVMACVEQHETEDVANARHRWHQVQGVGSVVLRGCEDGECQSTEQRILIGEQGQVDLEGLLHRGIVKALGDPLAVGFVGAFLPHLGQVRLTRRILHMGQKCSAFAPQVGAATEEVPGSAHGGGLARGLWEQAATKQGRHLVGIDLGVFGLAAMHGCHREGMPQNAGETFCSTQVSEPIPGKETRDGHYQTVTIRCDGLAERFRSGFPLTVQQHFALVVHDTDGHAPGMQVDTAVKGVLMGVESPVRSPLELVVLPKVSIPSWYAEGEASIIINHLQPTASSVRCAPAFRCG